MGVGAERGRFSHGNYPVHILWEAWRPPGSVWGVRKMSLLPGLDSRTVHPVASRYADYGLP
jgi:hypothetical protein